VGAPGSGFTAAFEALALALCRELPVRQAAALLRCKDKQLWRRIEFYVDQARALGELRRACRSWASTRPACAVASTTSPSCTTWTPSGCCSPPRARPPDGGGLRADLKAHGGDPAEVRHVCMDMSAAYAKGAAQALPAAAISYDRFHVIAMAIQAMDDVRREELRTEPEEVAAALLGADPETRRNLLWGMRKNPSGWSMAQTTRCTGCSARRSRARGPGGCAWRCARSTRAPGSTTAPSRRPAI
jgi:transposase